MCLRLDDVGWIRRCGEACVLKLDVMMSSVVNIGFIGRYIGDKSVIGPSLIRKIDYRPNLSAWSNIGQSRYLSVNIGCYRSISVNIKSLTFSFLVKNKWVLGLGFHFHNSISHKAANASTIPHFCDFETLCCLFHCNNETFCRIFLFKLSVFLFRFCPEFSVLHF